MSKSKVRLRRSNTSTIKELLEEFHELKAVNPAKQSDKMITRGGWASKIHFNASIIAIISAEQMETSLSLKAGSILNLGTTNAALVEDVVLEPSVKR